MQTVQKISSFVFLTLFLLLTTTTSAYAACDCGSTDSANPCTGNSISVTVVAGTPNGGTAVNSVYNWAFNSEGEEATCGTFANGDYWVAPAVGKSSVTITGITSNGDVSADVNPTIESMGLFGGSKTYGNYNAAENIIPNLPQTYSSITSILAGVKRNEAVEGGCGTAAIVGACADSYDVLTVLSSVPEKAGSETLRPNITGNTKELLTFDDFDFSLIPSKTFFKGTTVAGIETIRRKWSHSTEIFGLGTSGNAGKGYSEGGRAFRAHTLIDDYGAGVAANWYNDMVTLFSDDNTLAEKKPAVAAMLNYGLDLYHSIYDAPNGVSRYWQIGATQSAGKFMPPVFFAALAKSNTYAENLKKVSQNPNIHKDGPLELGQIHNGPNGYVWGDVPNLSGVNFQGSYWGNLFASQCYDGAFGTCNVALGSKTMYDPYGLIDGPPNKPGTSYMGSSLGVQKSMVAIMYLMPRIREIINHEPLVEYVNRVLDNGIKTANDFCVTPDSREILGTCDAYRNRGCLYYGVTWGPVAVADKASSCITTPTAPYNKVGRFTSIDGTKIGMVYKSLQIEANWETIRAQAGYTPGVTPTPTPTTPTCTNFTYSAWSTCTNNTQSRTVTTSSPTSCTGGTPVLTQSCSSEVVPPLTYTLTTTRAGTGSGTVSGSGISCGTDCSETVVTGTSVTLTAKPATDSTFTGWNGACSGTQTICTVSVNAAVNVLATFTLIETNTETIDITAPTFSNVVLTQTGSQGLTLTWTTSEPATTRLDYGTTLTLGLSTQEDTTLTRTHSVTLNKLQRGTTYYVQARSRDAAGNVGVATVKSVTIATKPGKVTNPKATAGSVNLSWKLPVVQNFTSITIYRNDVHIATLPATATTYRDTAVDPSTTYKYEIYTVDSDLVASDPVSISFKTRADVPKNEAKTTTPLPIPTTAPATTVGGGIIVTSPTPTLPTQTTASRYTFTAGLKLGITHADVRALQQFLNTHGYAVAATGPGSAGNETTYFGPATKSAVTRFQQANRLGDATSYGLVGPQTRAKLNELQGSATPTTATLPTYTGIRLTDAQRAMLERVLGISR